MTRLNEYTLTELGVAYEALGLCHDAEEMLKISQQIAVLSISIATSLLNQRIKK